MKGVFAKTHLVTMLQMYKAGQLPELEQAPQATAPSQVAVAGVSSGGTSEFQDVLEHGVFMHVFWSIGFGSGFPPLRAQIWPNMHFESKKRGLAVPTTKPVFVVQNLIVGCLRA